MIALEFDPHICVALSQESYLLVHHSRKLLVSEEA
jgi:hypothetical protein